MHLLLVIMNGLLAANAQWDSVNIFHRPEKVVIVIGENGPGKVAQLMDLWPLESFRVSTANNDFELTCNRDSQSAGCNMRFFPSTDVTIGNRSVGARILLSELKSDLDRDWAQSFLNSNGDQLQLAVKDGVLTISAAKRKLP